MNDYFLARTKIILMNIIKIYFIFSLILSNCNIGHAEPSKNRKHLFCKGSRFVLNNLVEPGFSFCSGNSQYQIGSGINYLFLIGGMVDFYTSYTHIHNHRVSTNFTVRIARGIRSLGDLDNFRSISIMLGFHIYKYFIELGPGLRSGVKSRYSNRSHGNDETVYQYKNKIFVDIRIGID